MQVYVRGVPLADQGAEDLCRVLNYCPQADTLWPRLTMSEVLHVFARLRGLSSRCTERLLSVAMRALRIEKYADRRFEAMSGGTKRKVCALPQRREQNSFTGCIMMNHIFSTAYSARTTLVYCIKVVLYSNNYTSSINQCG